jgi:hypothetical protein
MSTLKGARPQASATYLPERIAVRCGLFGPPRRCLYNVGVVERCSGIVCCDGRNLNCTLHYSRSLHGGSPDTRMLVVRYLSDVRRLCLPPV